MEVFYEKAGKCFVYWRDSFGFNYWQIMGFVVGLMYCMEYLEKNLDWLTDKLDDKEDHYVIFDCPGQVELYTHHTSMQAILKALESMGFRVIFNFFGAVQPFLQIDSFYL